MGRAAFTDGSRVNPGVSMDGWPVVEIPVIPIRLSACQQQ